MDVTKLMKTNLSTLKLTKLRVNYTSPDNIAVQFVDSFTVRVIKGNDDDVVIV